MFIHFHISGCKGTQIKANATAPPLLNFVNQADLVANGAEKDCLGDCLIEFIVQMQNWQSGHVQTAHLVGAVSHCILLR